MSNIYFFRGKAATGKTTISDALSNKINVPVLRKDDIFDVISQAIKDDSQNNNVTYSLLSKLIQTNIDNQADIIVDIGLSDTNGWKSFKEKIDFRDTSTYTFLCDCSDMVAWKARFVKRQENKKPNQYFQTVEEIIEYYKKSKIELLENEYYIDSSKSLDSILGFVCEKIGR